MEQLLTQASLSWSYSSARGVPVINPHGSINWRGISGKDSLLNISTGIILGMVATSRMISRNHCQIQTLAGLTEIWIIDLYQMVQIILRQIKT